MTVLQHPRKCQNGFTSSQIQDHVTMLLDHFHVEGPNGCHLCLVASVVGLSVVQYANAQPRKRLDDNLARTVALHVIGIGHGGMDAELSRANGSYKY